MERKVLLGQYLIWVMLLLGRIHGYRSCIEKEKKALLELKKYMISRREEREYLPLLPTWTNDTKNDCCMWEGVESDHTSERVVELSFGRPNLKESSLLNISLLHPFEEVRSLNLSFSFFNGLFDDVEGYKSLRRLRKLEILDLCDNTFNKSIFPFLSAATSLKTLILKNNYQMDGPLHFEELLSTLRKLKALSLSGNELSGSVEGVCKLKNIEELNLSRNKLVGQFPSCITSLTRLRVLDLSWNNLTGKLPSTLGNLESLEYLSFYDNNFEGIFSLGSLSNLSKLKVLKLGFETNSRKVDSKYSWKPKFQLSVISENSWKPKFQLSVISLETCNLEKVPHFLLYQKDLRHVDLSDNKLSGKFPYWLLENNTKLEVLLLKNNYFWRFQLPESDHNLICLDVSVNEFDDLYPQNIGWILPQLKYMNLANNGFQGNLPSSLSNMKRIEYLDISHNNFYGKLSKSFLEGCFSLEILKLSHNQLSGEIFLEFTNFTSMIGIFLDNNQFTGKIGQGWRNSRSLIMLDISNNNLTGVIPNWIGELSDLYALLLSNNSLEGEIPVSLFNISNLRLLDLSANKLSGGLPSHVSFIELGYLLLQGNTLSGSIPEMLVNVIVLDLRNNRFSGNIPEFSNTKNISILLLRGNDLTGRVPLQLCGLRNIQLLDLSNNRLNGSIPSCLSNTSFGFGNEGAIYDRYGLSNDFGFMFGTYFKSLIMDAKFLKAYEANFQTKIEFATKHRYDAYWGGNLKLFFGMDLSKNELSGEIPVELGGLQELQALNLSHNNLSGMIPKSFLGLKNVESLDLSFNRLQGRIPQQLTDLSMLSVFNVSYNNLSGLILEGRQFNTFDIQSYLGNPFLCGHATNRSCNNNDFQEPSNGEVEADESTIDMVSFYWSFVAAYVTILLGILASLSFASPWSRAWFYIVDGFFHWVRNLFW